ncbi:MAG: ATP-dependent Clp protease ATP-binding subunit [Clostridia bacterium]|nr:ATP-dependent Clp protease ATP-binding subunit [Clostridia bacterium]
MVMCSNCHKRVAVVFVNKIEEGKRTSQGLCIKCAKELGLPIENMMGDIYNKMGITPEQVEDMEDELAEMFPQGEDIGEDGGAPAIDLPKLFKDSGIADALKAAAENMPQASKNEGGIVVPVNPSQGKKEPPKGGKQQPKQYKYLTAYCKNLTQSAREGKLDRIVGREPETNRVIQTLCRRQKNNPCLIGEPGVGKTAIAEGLAIRIADRNVPYKLKDKEIFLVDLTALVAGTQFRGQFESRILGLLAEVKEHGRAILVIDEVHNIVGTGDAEGSVNAANILKPALSRGEVRIIGATTLNEYRKYIEKDSALERRFQPVTVNEPSIAEAVEMLRGISHYYEEFHKIRIPDSILYRAVTLSERYITDRYLPDKAIDLLDEAASKLSLSSSELNESLEIKDRLLRLKSDREALESLSAANDEESLKKYEEIARIQSEELQLSRRLDEIVPECDKIVLTEEHLADVVELWTGVPATSITENEYAKIDNLAQRLKKHLVGQDVAVDAVARAIKRNRAGIAYKRKPVSFIFAGPTGVGKTELVKTLAADLFDSPETLIRLDMSEFMEKHSVSRIIGSPPGYVGYDDAGQLTEKIRRRPYSVVLFDEIEKAHPDVLNILLQILDDGRITDAHGKTVNFENTVIVMTTNAGSENRSGIVGFTGDSAKNAEDKTEKALSSFLRPEFINRVDEIITFRSLNVDDFGKIAYIMLDQLAEVLAEKGMTLEYDGEVAKFIANGSFSEKYGARNMRRFIQKNVEDRLAELMIADYARSYKMATLSVENGELLVKCS